MTARKSIELFATLADMKDIDYKNMLAITAVIDLLIEKGIITHTEMADRAQQLDTASE